MASKKPKAKKSGIDISPVIPYPLGRPSDRRKIQNQLFGDPSKGWRDVAANSAMWLLPYAKGAKAINKGVNAVVKNKKTAKAVRGAAKAVGGVSATAAVDKAIRSTGRRGGSAKKK